MGPSLQPFKYAMTILPGQIDAGPIGFEPDAGQPSMSLTVSRSPTSSSLVSAIFDLANSSIS